MTREHNEQQRDPSSGPPADGPDDGTKIRSRDHSKQGSDTAGRLTWLVQISGSVRKELLEIARQPRLVLILVVGPFLVLALFAAGFDQKKTVLTTTFVGPADSIYSESVDEFTEDLAQYIDFGGYTSDLVAARAALDSGDIDLIVIFPTDPAQSVLAGEQAVITVLHDKIDPIQQTTVEVSAQVAVQELNAQILQEVVGTAQQALVPYQDSLTESIRILDELGQAVDAGDADAARRLSGELQESTGALSTIIDLSTQLSSRLEGDSSQQEGLAQLSAAGDDLNDLAARAARSEEIEDDEIAALSGALELVEEQGQTVTTLDPAVVVRPFSSDTENLQRERVSISDFFAPGAVALLLQHMVLTFAALSLVSDRSRGVFELFQVGPIGAGRVLLGKFVAFTLVGAAVSALLITAMKFGLGVPFRGSVGWVAVGVIALLVSSIAVGTLIALVSRSDTQAVQYALLALLAGLFFSGFFLDLDAFRYPAKALSWTMPITYGTRIFRDVMLRGNEAATLDLVGLAATAAVYTSVSWFLLTRRLRIT